MFNKIKNKICTVLLYLFDTIYTYEKYIRNNVCHDEGVYSSTDWIGDLHIGHSNNWLAQDAQKPLKYIPQLINLTGFT